MNNKNYSIDTEEVATTHLGDARKISQLRITVATRVVPFAGTDAGVFLDISKTGRYHLITQGENDFERGSIKSYSFQASFTLGDLRKSAIILSHDNSGQNPGWCVAGLRIEIKLHNSDILYLYKLWEDISWLSENKAPNYTTSVELQEITE